MNKKEIREQLKQLKEQNIFADFVKDILDEIELTKEPSLEETKKQLIKEIKDIKTNKDLNHFALNIVNSVLQHYHRFIDLEDEEEEE